MSDIATEHESAPPAKRSGASRLILHLVILIALGLAAFAWSFRNTALLHHPPSPAVPALIDDGMLQGTRHFAKIFKRDFLLRVVVPETDKEAATEYRPLGYAVLALARGVIPDNAVALWHLFFLALHLATALLLYALFRSLTGGEAALGLAAAYVCCPAFLPLMNDPNMIYIGVGLFFSALTLLCVQLFVKHSSAGWLVLAVAGFVGAMFTFRPALCVPAFIAALCLLSAARPRIAAALMVWLALAALAAIMLGLSPLVTGLALLALASAVGIAFGEGSMRLWAKTLPLFVAIGAGMFLLMDAVIPLPLDRLTITRTLNESRLFEPCMASFAAKALLKMYGSLGATMALAALVPVALFLKPGARRSMFVLIAAAFLTVTAFGNRLYRTDSEYWAGVFAANPDDKGPVQYHLAVAQCAAEKWSDAKNTLMRMKYISHVNSMTSRDLCGVLLGKVSLALGQEKIASFYTFSPVLSRDTWFAKEWLTCKGDAALKMGYVSCAESSWANALVADPYDLELYNKLGIALIYKNFFRAAKKHFDHVASFEPRNERALYYLAFIAKNGKDEREFARLRGEWQKAAGTTAEIDFKPVFDLYAGFNAEKMKGWVSDAPLSLRRIESQDPAMYYTLFSGNPDNYTKLSFPEVPLEAGEFLIASALREASAGNSPGAEQLFSDAEMYLNLSCSLKPTRKAVQLLLGLANRRGQSDNVREYKKVLESLSDEN